MLRAKVDKNFTRKEEAEEKDLITVIIVASIKWSHFSLKNKMHVYLLNISTHDSVFLKKVLVKEILTFDSSSSTNFLFWKIQTFSTIT